VFPQRGVRRDDIRPHTRIISIGKRVLVAFHLDEDVVTIDCVLYGGRDLGTAFPG
jgi:toxin ParE1/3/4